MQGINSNACMSHKFKIHDREWPFLIDQRGDRQMVIGSIDPLDKEKAKKEISTLEHSILVEKEGKRKRG